MKTIDLKLNKKQKDFFTSNAKYVALTSGLG